MAREDYPLLERIREQYLCFAGFGEQAHVDAILELLDADAAEHDPDWKRPEVMGKSPRAVVKAILEPRPC